MKKHFHLLLFFTFSSIGQINAQLEVIDKIAEVLIPGITNGIKTVMESSNGNRVKKEDVQELKSDILTDINGIVDEIGKDVNNISALNELFSITGALFDNIGSMKALTNETFLIQIDSTKSHALYRETAILFSFQWRQVEAKKDKLVSSTSGASRGSVQDDIAQYISVLDENLIDLTTAIGLVKNPSEDMDFTTSSNYLKGMKRARVYIEAIEDAVKAINVQLSTRIRGLEKSLEDAKTEIGTLIENEN